MSFHLQLWKTQQLSVLPCCMITALMSLMWEKASQLQCKALHFYLIHRSCKQKYKVLEDQTGILQGKNWYKQDFHTFFSTPIQRRHWLLPQNLLHHLVSAGNVTKILPCWRVYTYSSWATSNALFWQICSDCINYTYHLPTVSWHFVTFIPVYDSLCSANWVENRRFLGNNGWCCSQRYTSETAQQSLVGKYVVKPQNPPPHVVTV